MFQMIFLITVVANLVLVRSYVKINTIQITRQSSLSVIDKKNNEKYTECVISPDDLGVLFGSEFICDDDADDVEESEVISSSQISSDDEDFSNDNLNSPNILSTLAQNMDVSEIAKQEIDESSTFDDGMTDYMNFLNLDRRLDMDDRKVVMKTLTMQSNADLLGLQTITPRNLTYDPLTTSKFRYDPMNFGAYKRWRDMEARVKDTKDSKSKSKKKSGKQNDSFMDQIKKLGSGPAPKGTATGVGVADPPPKMKPIQMKRSTVSRTPSSKRKVITPDDIDSLFPKSKFANKNTDAKLQENEEEEDNDDDNDSNTGSTKSDLMKSSKRTFNPLDTSAIPDWIIEADNEDKRRKSTKKQKKQKTLTQDWRFWAAIVATAGFATAAFNIYQQTGGLLERQELII